MMNLIYIITLSLFLSAGEAIHTDTDDEENVTDSEIEVAENPFDVYYQLLPEPLQYAIYDEGWYDDFKNCFEELIDTIELPVLVPDSTDTSTLPGAISTTGDDTLLPGLKGCENNSNSNQE
jgi:hypothetical protein